MRARTDTDTESTSASRTPATHTTEQAEASPAYQHGTQPQNPQQKTSAATSNYSVNVHVISMQEADISDAEQSTA